MTMNTRGTAMNKPLQSVVAQPKAISSRAALQESWKRGRSVVSAHRVSVPRQTSNTCCATKLHTPAPMNASEMATTAELARPSSERSASARNSSLRRCIATTTLPKPMPIGA
jgi:hypothetical protein